MAVPNYHRFSRLQYDSETPSMKSLETWMRDRHAVAHLFGEILILVVTIRVAFHGRWEEKLPNCWPMTSHLWASTKGSFTACDARFVFPGLWYIDYIATCNHVHTVITHPKQNNQEPLPRKTGDLGDAHFSAALDFRWKIRSPNRSTKKAGCKACSSSGSMSADRRNSFMKGGSTIDYY